MLDKERMIPALPHAAQLPAIVEPLLRWYRYRARTLPWRETPTPYRIWLSEIMLQQTRVAAVIPYFTRFLEALPDVRALASVDDDRLMKLWQGLGYYSRARNLKKAAILIMEEYDGNIPLDFHALLSLPGIGRYTAAAISSIAGGAPIPAVDGNVLRVVTRLTLCREDVLKDSTKRLIETALQPCYTAGPSSSMLNQALMELGATVCVPNGLPHCARCPLMRLCLAYEAACPQDFPVKHAKKHRRQIKRTVLLIRWQDRIALKKRPAKGLLAGLYELPNLPGHSTQDEVVSFLHGQEYEISAIRPDRSARHIFTHVEWDMISFAIMLAPQSDPSSKTTARNRYLWVSRQALADSYSIPAAFQYFLPALS